MVTFFNVVESAVTNLEGHGITDDMNLPEAFVCDVYMTTTTTAF